MLSRFGRGLMLGLSPLSDLEVSLHLFWHRQWGSIFPASVSLSALVFCWSALYILTLLSPMTLPAGPPAKFNWLQATFFFRWPTSGIHLYLGVYQHISWPDKLKVLRPSQGSHFSLFPATAAKHSFMLIGSSSGNHPPVHFVCPTAVVTCTLTSTIKTPFIDMKWRTSISPSFSVLFGDDATPSSGVADGAGLGLDWQYS